MRAESPRRGRMRTVVVMTRDPATRENLCRIPDKLAERFAGYEPDDHRLWGTEVLRARGAWWLLQLDGCRLAVPLESLAAFRQECAAALELSAALAVESGCLLADIRQVLQNFLRAAEQAESVGGWVEVW
jgi:hypothetical protein